MYVRIERPSICVLFPCFRTVSYMHACPLSRVPENTPEQQSYFLLEFNSEAGGIDITRIKLLLNDDLVGSS